MKAIIAKYTVVCVLIHHLFSLRSFAMDKMDNGYNNVYFNNAYCTGSGEQDIETKLPDSLAVKNSENVAAPTYETLHSGANVDASIYETVNNEPASVEYIYM